MTEEQAQRRRPLWPGWRAIAIAAAAAVTGIAALIALRAPETPTPHFSGTLDDVAPAKVWPDPLMAELLRCRTLPAGSDNAACREAWEVNRRRFTGESRTYVAPPAAPAGEGN